MSVDRVNARITNLEPTPKTITCKHIFLSPSRGATDEDCAIYLKTDHSTGNAIVGIYGEVDAAQIDTAGSWLKLIHKGAGDAIYVANFNNGPAFESANFYNGARGIISTNQRTMPGSGTDFGNTTLFQGVWGDDGTGGSTTPPLYGMFYAALSLGNSFRTRLQSTSATGWASGRTEWAISEYALDRDRFQVYNDGTLRLLSTKATGGATTKAAPAIQLYGSYYTAGAAQDQSILLQPAIDGSGNPSLVVKAGTAGAESTLFTFALTGTTLAGNLALGGNDITGVDDITMGGAGSVLDMQTGTITSVGGLTFASAPTVDFQAGDITNIDDITFAGSGSVVDLQAGSITTVGSLTMYASGTGIDMQGKAIATCGAITGYSSPDITGFAKSTWTGDVIVNNSAKGLVLKDTAGSPHYWRVSVSTLGALTTADLGTSLP